MRLARGGRRLAGSAAESGRLGCPSLAGAAAANFLVIPCGRPWRPVLLGRWDQRSQRTTMPILSRALATSQRTTLGVIRPLSAHVSPENNLHAPWRGQPKGVPQT